jgi:tetratricopeptide (TPR) repeat protein
MLIRDLNSEGKLSYDKGKFDEAIRFFKNTLGIDPEDEIGLVGMGNSLKINGKFDKARNFYDKAIELYPESTWAWNAKGLGYKQINEYNEAIKCFEKSIQLDPKDSQGYYNIACTFSLKKDSDKAIQFLRNATEISKTKNVLKAKNDKDFDYIREKPEFINLINFK